MNTLVNVEPGAFYRLLYLKQNEYIISQFNLLVGLNCESYRIKLNYGELQHTNMYHLHGVLHLVPGQPVHLQQEDDLLECWKYSIGFALKNWAIKMYIMYYEQFQHLHDVLPLVLDQLVHLHHDEVFLEFWKYFYWICLEKLGYKHVHYANNYADK